MPGKRKRTSAASTPARKKNKRPSDVHAFPELNQGSTRQDEFWEIRSILAENKTKYQIDWADDPRTGKKFPPEWVPKAHVTQLAINEWERRKAENKSRGRATTNSRLAKRSEDSPESAAGPAPKSDRSRARRIVQSSPTSAQNQSQNNTHDQGSVEESAVEPEPEIANSQDTDTVAEIEQRIASPPFASISQSVVPQPVARKSAVVQLSKPPSSWANGAYERISSSRPSTSEDSSESLSSPPSTPEAIPEVVQSSQLPNKSSSNETASDKVVQQLSIQGKQSIPDSQSQQEISGIQDSSQTRSVGVQHPRADTEAVAEVEAIEQAGQGAVIEPNLPSLSSQDQIIQTGVTSSQRGPTGAGTVESLDLPAARTETEPPTQLGGQFAGVGPYLQAPERSGEQQSGEQQISEQSSGEQPSEEHPSEEQPSESQRSTQRESHSPTSQLDGETELDIGVTLQQAKQTEDQQPEGGETQVTSERTISSEQSATSARDTSAVIVTDSKQSEQAIPAATSQPGNSTAASSQDVIVVSSEEDRSGTSEHLISSVESKSPPRTADFVPPPAGQRPLPSSLPNVTIPQRPVEANLPASLGPSPANYSSSFPFQTQAPTTVSNPGFAQPKYSPERRALPRSPVTAKGSTLISLQSLLSSPFPSIPSRSLGTVGESAPQPFDTFSPSVSPSVSPRKTTMDSSSKRERERVDFKAELRAKREQRKAASTSARRSFTPTPRSSMSSEQPASALPPEIRSEIAASQAAAQAGRLGSPLAPLLEGTRSPSMVPAVESVPNVTKEEMNTSERFETLLPQAQDHGAPEHAQNGTLTEHESPKPPRYPNEDPEMSHIFAVPVAPSPLQRDQYKENIYYKQNLISKFLKVRDPPTELVDEADKFLDRLRDIAMHPDLINPETLSQTAEPERQAKWDANCSTKFHFLKEFLDRMQEREQKLHVAIVVKGQRLPDMVENFLSGIHMLNYRYIKPRTDQLDFHTSVERLKVSIVDLDSELKSEDVHAADIVISLDASVDPRNPVVRALRRKTLKIQGSDTDTWSVLLTLVLPRTVEHMELCLPKNVSASVRTRMLMKATQELRYESGRLEPTQAPVQEAVVNIANFIDNDEVQEWPLAPLSQLEELDSQTETDIELSTSHDADTSAIGKRSVEEMEIDTALTDAPKRARHISPEASKVPTTIDPLDTELTHVSDSLEHGAAPTQMMSESHQPEPSVDVQQLQDQLQNTQDRLDEHVKALEGLQYRHEDQRKKLVEVTRERNSAIDQAVAATERASSSKAQIASLISERTQLKEALSDAHKRLLDDTIPEKAEFEKLRLLMEKANIDKDKAEKRTESIQKDLDWTRSMYQDTSSRASELGNKNRELENSLAVAENKAAGQAALAREISTKGHDKRNAQEVTRLKLMLDQRNAAIKCRDEEIKQLKDSGRGRIGTRQSSVPRSPRMGSPMKGRGSRAASPAAGDLGTKGKAQHLHPLRQGG